MSLKKIVILGAGPAGLTAAYELLKFDPRQYQVVILEQSRQIGGIAKTVEYHGNRMDLGGHRFFTKSKEINCLWEEILGKSLKTRQRQSRIFFNEKLFDYPLKLNIDLVRKLGLKTTLACGFSYLASQIFPREELSLEDFYVNRFGKKLYSLFFENYTKNVWGKHPSVLSPDWGAQRIKGVSVSEILKNALSKKFQKQNTQKTETSLIEEFLYPDLGPGEMWNALADKIEKLGGKIILGANVIRIHKTKDSKLDSLTYLKSGKETIVKPDFVISSLPLKNLIESTNSIPEKVRRIANGLRHRDYITIGVLIKNDKKNPPQISKLKDTWLYIHDKNVKLGRIQIYNNWSEKLVKDPKKYTWVGLEYFTNTNKKFWKKSDEEIIRQGIKELKKLGLINSKQDVSDAHVERVEKAYPAYFGTYKKLNRLRNYLNKIPNLYCIGRNGQHRYNNMDHSMLTAIEAVNNIRYGTKSNNPAEKNNIWAVNTEEEYHETNNQTKKTTIFGLPKPLFFVFLIWSAITLATALVFHENWEDEAQAWLIARDCSIFELVARMKIEGHFLPWYLLIMPFAKLSFPFKTINLINWAMFAWGIWLFLKDYPGKAWKKVILIFSSAFLFWYPVVARCYCFLLPAVMLLVKNYRKRYEHPFAFLLPLVLLVNVHIHVLAFATIVGLDYLFGWLKLRKTFDSTLNKKILLSGLFALVLIVFSGLPMLGSVGTATNSTASNVNFSTEGVTLTSALTGPLIFYTQFLADGVPSILVYILLSLFVINLLKTRSRVFWKTAIALLFSLALQAFVFASYLPQRIFMVLIFYLFFSVTEKSQRLPILTELPVFVLLLVMAFQTGNTFCSVFLFVYVIQALLPWYLRRLHGIDIQKTLKSLAQISLPLLGILSVIAGFRTVGAEFQQPYTDAKIVADYLMQRYSDQEEILILVDTLPLTIYTPILAYLPGNYKLININSGVMFTYDKEIVIKYTSTNDSLEEKEPEEETKELEGGKEQITNYSSECKKYTINSDQPCLYLVFYDPNFYNEVVKELEEFGVISNVKKQELDGTLTLLIDSFQEEDKFEQAPYEHYRLYSINNYQN